MRIWRSSQPPRCEESDEFRRREEQGWGVFSSPLKPSKRKLWNCITVMREDIPGSRQVEIANLTFPPQARAKSRTSPQRWWWWKERCYGTWISDAVYLNLSLIFLDVFPLLTLGNRPGRQTLIFIQYPSSRKHTCLIIYTWTSLSFKSLSPVNRSHACHSFSVAIKRSPYLWKRWICM